MSLGVYCLEGEYRVLQCHRGVRVGSPVHLHELGPNTLFNPGSLILLQQFAAVVLKQDFLDGNGPDYVSIISEGNVTGGTYADKDAVWQVAEHVEKVRGLYLIPYSTIDQLAKIFEELESERAKV